MSSQPSISRIALADSQLVRLQEAIPYQGNGSPSEISEAGRELERMRCDGLVGFPPILIGRKRERLLAAIEISHDIYLQAASGPIETAELVKFLSHVPLLLTYSVPSLLPTLERVLTAASPESRTFGKALQWFGDSAHYLKRYSDAEVVYQRLLTWGESAGIPHRIAHAHRGLGDCAMKKGHFPEALILYNRAHKIYAALDKPRSMGRVVRNLADAKRVLNGCKAADRLYKKAAEISRGLNDRWNLAKALQERGWNAWLSGNAEFARRLFLSALAEYEPTTRIRGRFTCWFALARIFGYNRLGLDVLTPTPAEEQSARLLGHRPWLERGTLLGFCQIQV